MNDHRLLFRKEGRAKYISHLDLMHTMQRSFIRAGIAIRHTGGFNPHPYMSFALPLSVGQESECELMDFGLLSDIPLDKLPDILNKALPEGITALSAYEAQRKMSELKWLAVSGVFTYNVGVPDNSADMLASLFSAVALVIEKRTKKGLAETDVAPMLKSIIFKKTDENHIALTATVAAQNPSLNPALITDAIERYAPALKPDFAAFRRTGVFDTDMKEFR